MEPKKSDKANLEKKSPMFLSLGFLIAMGAVLAAFEYKSKPEMDINPYTFEGGEIEEPIIIPITEITPPPPPPKPAPVIVETEEEIIEEPELEVFELEIDESSIIDNTVETEKPKEEIIENKVHDFVEQSAHFPGGQEAWMKYLNNNLKYPAKARRMGIEGRVYIQFIIDKTGELTNIKVVKPIGGGLDEEALRVIKNAPKWNPGKQRGREVRQRMTIPVYFRLQ
ncbi:TonB family protein [Mangrovivirga sp. M17]|uniref:TonB family protein n=1 Tax=Mangrovivirga halotolerans TaxID=2993936 RepID=A0ABT3RM52_9BACT|nr:energy transducer TonB [Mangrovivirga halotolerans]MCX2742889.1 TonB family protein [Mangrovivirga halotolerans]